MKGNSGTDEQILDEQLEKISERMSRDRCVAYVGAGFSMPCGMLGWSSLIDKLIQRASSISHSTKLDQARLELKNGNLLNAATLVGQVLPRAEINDCLDELFGDAALARSKNPQKQHMKERMHDLVSTGWAGLVTTNYDKLIEQGFNAKNEDYDWKDYRAVDGDSEQLGHLLIKSRAAQTFLVKLHGSVNSNRMILNTAQFDEIYQHTPQIPAFLEALMFHYHLIFIGCSLESQDEVIRIRRKLTVQFKGGIPKAYAILPRDPRNEARTEAFREASIDPIWYGLAQPIDHEHRGLDGILRKLARMPRSPIETRIAERTTNLYERYKNESPANKRILEYLAASIEDGRTLQEIEDQVDTNPVRRASYERRSKNGPQSAA